MKLAYQAYDKNGKAVSATIESTSEAEARELLRREGLFVTEITEQAITPTARTTRSWRGVSSGQRLKNLSMFARQLHILVTSGTPLVQALGAMERQTHDERWQRVVASLREEVEEGIPLSQAMEKQSQYFDIVCRTLIAAGEASGNMGVMLERLCSLVQKQLHLRRTIVGAMIYPCLLVVVGICVLTLMLLFVLPRFVELFHTLDVKLPPTTRMLVFLSDGLQAYWWAVLAAVVSAVIGIKLWTSSTAGHKILQTIILRLPKMGSLVKNLVTARMARLLGVLLESKVSLLEALQLTKQAETNHRYAELIGNAELAVSRGEPISAAFADADLINPSIYETIRNGEQSGQVGSLLLHMAGFMDEENEIVVKALMTLIEPIILLSLGVMVALIALSMFMPLFDLAATAQGGGA